MDAFYASSVYADLSVHSWSNQYPCFSLKEVGYGFMRKFLGLVALTSVVPSPSVSDSSEFENVIKAAFEGWSPAGCEFRGGGLRRYLSSTWARSKSVDKVESVATATQDAVGQGSYYHIFCWTGNGGSLENTAAAARDPAAFTSWATAIAKAGESIESWDQELWEIERLFWCNI
jgi:hypothetical protein